MHQLCRLTSTLQSMWMALWPNTHRCLYLCRKRRVLISPSCPEMMLFLPSVYSHLTGPLDTCCTLSHVCVCLNCSKVWRPRGQRLEAILLTFNLRADGWSSCMGPCCQLPNRDKAVMWNCQERNPEPHSLGSYTSSTTIYQLWAQIPAQCINGDNDTTSSPWLLWGLNGMTCIEWFGQCLTDSKTWRKVCPYHFPSIYAYV